MSTLGVVTARARGSASCGTCRKRLSFWRAGFASLTVALPARAVHLVQREEIDRRAARQVVAASRLLLRCAAPAARARAPHRARARRAALHAARSRDRRRSITKAAAARHGSIVQNERARPDGEASTKATAPSSRLGLPAVGRRLHAEAERRGVLAGEGDRGRPELAQLGVQRARRPSRRALSSWSEPYSVLLRSVSPMRQASSSG